MQKFCSLFLFTLIVLSSIDLSYGNELGQIGLMLRPMVEWVMNVIHLLEVKVFHPLIEFGHYVGNLVETGLVAISERISGLFPQ